MLVLEFNLAAKECFAYVGGSELLDPDNRSLEEVDGLPIAAVPDEAGLDALLPTQGGLFEEQPTLHPDSGSGATGSDEQRAGLSGQGIGGNRAELVAQPVAVPRAVALRESGSVDRPEVVQVLLDQLDATVQPEVRESVARECLEDGHGSVAKESLEMCVVPGCERPGKNKLGVRCRVWHEPSPVPGKTKTSALWAPDADAFLCDDHALGGAHITLIFEPNDSGETAIRVIAAPKGDERTRPIKQPSEKDGS